MTPDSRMLLLQVRRVLAGLRGRAGQESGTAIDYADIVLNELLLRTSDAFYIEHYRKGRALAEREQVGGLDGLPLSVHADTHPELVDAHTRALAEALASAVGRIGAGATGAARRFIEDASAWEDELYAHRMKEAPLPEITPPIETMFTRERIEAYLAHRLPESRDLRIAAFKPLPGGFSKTTILIDTEDKHHGRRAMVVRIEPPISTIALVTQSLAVEYPIVELAYARGLPVAEPILLEPDADVLGLPFCVFQKVAGENYGSVAGTSKPISDGIVHTIAELLARIGRMPLSADDEAVRRTFLSHWVSKGTMREATRALIDYWLERGRIRGNDPSPTVTMAYDWLMANVPDFDGPPVLVHGDFGLHNVLFQDEKATALLDWEACYAGDPAGDLSNLLFATDGKLDRTLLLDSYHKAGGLPVTADRIAYFDVFNAYKMTVAHLAPSKLVDRDPRAPISFAVLGLRYMHFVTSRLPDLIRAAERSKGSR